MPMMKRPPMSEMPMPGDPQATPPDGGTGGGEGDLMQMLMRGGLGALQGGGMGGLGGVLPQILQQLLAAKLGPKAGMMKRAPAAQPMGMGDALPGGMPRA